MLIDKDTYLKKWYGYRVTDCVVRNKDIFYFVARNEEQGSRAGPTQQETVVKRVISFILSEPEESRWGRQTLNHFSRIHAGVALLPKEQFVGVDAGGHVYAVGSGVAEMEESIPGSKEGPLRGAVHRVRTIDKYLYVVGGFHSVCRRTDRNQWESLCFNLPVPVNPTKKEYCRAVIEMGFDDIDGFSHDDLYTIGWKGRVWHCDGKQWRPIAFPSNMYLHSICCAGDGFVYIGAQSGTVFKGRGDQWTMLERGHMALPFNDMVWHAGKVWCTSDYGLWCIEGGKIVKPDLPAEITVCAGHLSVADGVMLMAGVNGAAYHDGQNWTLIFNTYEMDTLVEAG